MINVGEQSELILGAVVGISHDEKKKGEINERGERLAQSHPKRLHVPTY